MPRFGNIYTAAIGLSDDHARRKQEIQNDPRLSPLGRKEAIEKLDTESLKVMDKLFATYRKDYEKHAETINSQMRKKQSDPIAKMKELLRTDMIKDVNLSSYHTVTDPIVSDNTRTMLLLQSLDGLSNKITSAAETQVLSRRSADWVRKERDKAVAAKDIQRVEQLLRAAKLRDNETEAEQLESVLTSDLERLHAENRTPEELEVANQLEALNHEARLLEASFESFRNPESRQYARDPKDRQFIDYRQTEVEPATTLHDVNSRGLPAGQSNGGEGATEG